MADVLPDIAPDLAEWIAAQRVFFVSTAPLAADGHINCSPKGMDTFRVIGPRHVAYVDLTGSGIETVAHLNENGRIVFMFCAWEGPPRIARLHGRGRVLLSGSPEYVQLRGRFPAALDVGARAIVCADIDLVSTSCGFAVPRCEFRAERDGLAKWSEKKGPDGLAAYRRSKNVSSIDGLPGLPRPVV